MLLYDRQIVTQNVTKKKKRIGKPIRFIWYIIRGSNDLVRVEKNGGFYALYSFTTSAGARIRMPPANPNSQAARISKELEKRSDLDRMEDKIKTVL